MKKNQIKEKLIVESQAYCERKQETSIHEILSNGLYLWLGIFENTNCWKHYCKTSWVIKNKKRHTLVSKIYWSYLWKHAMHEIWSSFMITTQDKKMKIWEWNMKFIVDVQSLTQHGKGKWWRNQPRWLVRGTKQALGRHRLWDHLFQDTLKA